MKVNCCWIENRRKDHIIFGTAFCDHCKDFAQRTLFEAWTKLLYSLKKILIFLTLSDEWTHWINTEQQTIPLNHSINFVKWLKAIHSTVCGCKICPTKQRIHFPHIHAWTISVLLQLTINCSVPFTQPTTPFLLENIAFVENN